MTRRTGPTRIAAAPTSFRGSLTALEATACLIAGLEASALDCDVMPMPLADGGNGTLDVILRALGGERLWLSVTGPDGSPVNAPLGLLHDGQTAIVEMAQASGVELLPREKRNPLLTTTYGTGELIRAAVERGFRRILVGLGGSATVDGGAGCLQALGARLLDADSRDIPPGGAGLARLARLDVTALHRRMADIELIALCDVDNPTLGPLGAAPVFGPQKGADPAAVAELDANLTHFVQIIRRDLGADVSDLHHGGAAGGFSAGLKAFLDAQLVPGADAIIDLLGYDPQLATMDWVITGEGKLDEQTGGGKAPLGIARRAGAFGVPCVALAGTLSATPQALRAMGFAAAWSILRGPATLDEANRQAGAWLTRAATTFGDLLHAAYAGLDA